MTSVTRTPMELHKGDTIVRHPDTGAYGQWLVQSRHYAPGDLVDVHYDTPDGGIGVFSLDPVARLQVEPEPRMAVIHGLRQFATFLETHPEVPVEQWPTINHYVDNDRALTTTRRAEVERVAGLLGVEPATSEGRDHYVARKFFGPVEYKAVSCHPDAETTTEATR